MKKYYQPVFQKRLILGFSTLLTKKSTWICPFPYQRMTIMWDGTVTACKNDYNGKMALGNVNHDSLEKCWIHSLKTLREQHRKGSAHEIQACRECPLRLSELSKAL